MEPSRKKHKPFSIESIMEPDSADSVDLDDSEELEINRSPTPSPPPEQNQETQLTNNNQPASNHASASSSTSTKTTNSCNSPTSARLNMVECQLDNLDMWHRFHPLDTEMIITKQGRRMFPPVRVTFSMSQLQQSTLVQQQQQQQQQPLTLNARDKYHVLMDILPYDNKRYRYAYHKSSWQQAGKADPRSPAKLFLHPDGPFSLDQLKRQVISFEKIKLTNNDANKHGFIVLNSMHKYQPRIHLVLWRGKESQSLANAPVSQLEGETYKTFIFKETIFTAVTAYQNHSITKLKIDSNPFAKGFRDSSRLTDLELESMTDLMSEGQCPFSPPRAPPHGFPHFLFAAAASAAQHHHQQGPIGGAPGAVNGAEYPELQQLMGEDPASALLRERTIIALDSFLQQQHQHQHKVQHQQHHHLQQHHHHHHHNHQQQQQQQQQSPSCGADDGATSTRSPFTPNSESASRNEGVASPQQQQQQSQVGQSNKSQLQQLTGGASHPRLDMNATSGGHGPAQPPPGTLPLGCGQLSLEQLIMQQQHQFAAAMAAAAAAAAAATSNASSTNPAHYPPPSGQLAGNPHYPHFYPLPPGGIACTQATSNGVQQQLAAAPNSQLHTTAAHQQQQQYQAQAATAVALHQAAAAVAAANSTSAAQEQYIYIEKLRELSRGK